MNSSDKKTVLITLIGMIGSLGTLVLILGGHLEVALPWGTVSVGSIAAVARKP